MVPTSSKELKLHLNSPKPKWRPELESQMFSLLCMGRSHPPDVRLQSQRARQQEMVARKSRQWVFISTGCLALWWEMSEPWVNLCSEEGAPGFISLSSFLEGRSEREPILVYQTLQLSTLILSTEVDSAQKVVLKPVCLHQSLAFAAKGGAKNTWDKTRSPCYVPMNI